MRRAEPPKEPLNKSRVAATEAFRDELREAARSPWQAPMGERRDKADRPESPVPPGFGAITRPAKLRCGPLGRALRRAAPRRVRGRRPAHAPQRGPWPRC